MRLLTVALLALLPASCALSSASRLGAPTPATHSVKEISLSRTANGWGAGEASALTFSSKGVAKLQILGRMVKNKDGSYSPQILETLTGTLARERFAMLAQTLDREDFWGMKSRYDSAATDQARSTISVLDGAKRVQVTVDGGAGPAGFTRLAQLLHEQRRSTSWKKAKPSRERSPKR